MTGNVHVSFMDNYEKLYERVSNVSIGSGWVFIKFANGSRIQIPSGSVRELSESPEVFIKGLREGKSNV